MRGYEDHRGIDGEMKRKTKVGVLAASAAAVAVAGGGGTAGAAAAHLYSVGTESTYNYYTAVSNTRAEPSFSNVPNTGCSGYFQTGAVYTSEWVSLTSDSQNWLELGTGHQCADTLRYQYWGYGIGGSWVPLGEDSDDHASHTYYILYDANNSRWNFKIDSYLEGHLGPGYIPNHGVNVQAGLESYDNAVTVSNYSNSNLGFNTGNGWKNWAGQDAHRVDSYMCGAFYPTDYNWISGENSC